MDERVEQYLRIIGDLADDWRDYYRRHPDDKYAAGKCHTFSYCFSKLCEVLEVEEKDYLPPDQAEG